MNTRVNLLCTRARTVIGMRDTGCKWTVPAGKGIQGLSGQRHSHAGIRGPGIYRIRITSPLDEVLELEMPIRICLHCGYEIRTRIDGDLSCTRCENDLNPGEGMETSPVFLLLGISDGGSRLSSPETRLNFRSLPEP
jgi:hypothetical protein